MSVRRFMLMLAGTFLLSMLSTCGWQEYY